MTNPDYDINFFDVTTINPSLKGYSGVAFDGRYLYYAPLSNTMGVFHGFVIRCNTLNEFQNVDSWESFDITTLNSQACGFVDAFFDGQFVYFIPYHNTQHHGLVARYNTRESLDSPDAWSFFDLTQNLDPNCRGFVSGDFDCRYLYLAPYQCSWTQYNGRMVRFDTKSAFDDTNSWKMFDSESKWPESRGFHGVVSTLDHTYFIPYVRENRDYHGFLVRHQKNTEFDDPNNWSNIDLTSIHPLAKGFVGGCFDGRYLYLAPYFNGIERHGLVLRADTTRDLMDVTSWETFDMTSLHIDNRGYFGAVVHGDFIYMLPHCKAEGIYQGRLVRYDRRMDFQSPDAWHFHDTAQNHPRSMGYMGCATVGSNLYMAPYEIAPFDHSGLMVKISINDKK